MATMQRHSKTTSSSDSSGSNTETNTQALAYEKVVLPKVAGAADGSPALLGSATVSTKSSENYWLKLENDPRLEHYRARAEKNLDSLMTKMKTEFENDPRPLNEKIQSAYNIMKNQGFRFAEFPTIDPLRSSLTYSLAEKRLDCDTSSSLVVELGKQLGWKDLEVVVVKGHAFIRRDGTNFDLGKSPSDSDYLKEFWRFS
jgi:hypothetical protein